MGDIVPVKDNNVLLNAKVDAPSNKLLLEASLLGGGIKDGFVARKDEALSNPGLTALEFAGAAAIGAGITLANKAGGKWGVAARVASKALGYVAIADGARRLAPTGYAMYDTFVNPGNYGDNRATVAKYLGSACFDYPLMAAGGILGSSAAHFGPRAASSMLNKFRPANSEPEPALRWDDSLFGTGKAGSESGPLKASKGWNEADLLKVDTRKLLESVKPTEANLKAAKGWNEADLLKVDTRKLLESLKPTEANLRAAKGWNEADLLKVDTRKLLESVKPTEANLKAAKGWNEADLLKVDTRKLLESVKPTEAVSNSGMKIGVNERGAISATTPTEAILNSGIKIGINERAAMSASHAERIWGNRRPGLPEKFDLPKFDIDPRIMKLEVPKFEIPNLIQSSTLRPNNIVIIPLPLSDYEKLELRKIKN